MSNDQVKNLASSCSMGLGEENWNLFTYFQGERLRDFPLAASGQFDRELPPIFWSELALTGLGVPEMRLR